MIINFQEQVPMGLSDDSRVWVYQSNRAFTIHESLQIEELLSNFAHNWKSHGTTVKGFANIFLGQFIIFIADESASGVSGCSTDGSVRLVKNIEKDFNVDMFDRLLHAFIVNERIQMIPLSKLNGCFEDGLLNASTLYFNNTILTKKELLGHWIIPVKESWLARRVPFLSAS